MSCNLDFLGACSRHDLAPKVFFPDAAALRFRQLEGVSSRADLCHAPVFSETRPSFKPGFSAA